MRISASVSRSCRTVGTLVLRLPLSSDDLYPPDMSDRSERTIARHIHIEQRSDSQDCFDPPKRRTALNCRKRHLPAKRQTVSIHNDGSITRMRTSRHNRHCLRRAGLTVGRGACQQMSGIRQELNRGQNRTNRLCGSRRFLRLAGRAPALP